MKKEFLLSKEMKEDMAKRIFDSWLSQTNRSIHFVLWDHVCAELVGAGVRYTDMDISKLTSLVEGLHSDHENKQDKIRAIQKRVDIY